MTDHTDQTNLEFIINHVFLPPKLPDNADGDMLEREAALLDVVRYTAEMYREQLPEYYQGWDKYVKMLSTMFDLQGGRPLGKQRLVGAIRGMESGDFLALYVEAQNAGLIIRQRDQHMIFESFEASPKAAEVMACQGRLICSYPGPAVTVRLDKVRDPGFLNELSSFLEKMNMERIEEAMPKSRKGGSVHVETRDTANPRFITEMLTGILRGIGQSVEVDRMQKRIADDVVLRKGNTPWRRSPLWLVIRVALQSTLDRDSDPSMFGQYKIFMVFLMAEILEMAVERQFPSDILFVMNAKLARRAYKIEEMPPFVLSKVLDQVSRTTQILEGRWDQVQQSPPLDWEPQTISSRKDLLLSLDNSGKYLASVIGRRVGIPKSNVFRTRYEPRDIGSNLPVRNLVMAYGAERYIALADFEFWVQWYLDEWIAGNVHREGACSELANCINQYTSVGREAYKCNPESISILILTTMDLWIALDKVAVKAYPLLSDYLPEFPVTIFHKLLLPRRHQMDRLHRIETYLAERRARANLSNPSVFDDNVGAKSFAIRYFNDSLMHQRLERTILDGATLELKLKIAEFEMKDKQYDALIAEADSLTCDLNFYNRKKGKNVHKEKRCRKCTLGKTARKIKIEVHEWPLPEDGMKRKAVVFELQCPRGFSVWRDTTYRILVDILSPPEPANTPQPPCEEFEGYHGLKKYYIKPGQQQLQWSSKTKSTLRSHYGGIAFPTSVQNICVKNALQYKLFDAGGTGWVQERLGKCDVQDICTFKLPKGPYQALQYAVDSTSHTSNETISSQFKCPIELTMHEYLAFGMLREGHRLQWLNIAREIRTRNLTFSHEAVNILLMQAAWQAGPPDTTKGRENHTFLQSLRFGETLIRELHEMLTSIEANWLEGVSARTLILLTARLLSVTNIARIKEGSFKLLRRARAVTLKWTRELILRLRDCDKEEDMMGLQLRALQMAATCRATYDVDCEDLHHVLSSNDDIATLTECAIIIHDNTPAASGGLSLPTRILLDRDRRLSHTLETILRQLIIIKDEGLNRSVSSVWEGFESGSKWKFVDAPNDRWIEVETKSTSPKLVRYNLIDGQLLIDGFPLGRLPNDYVSHPTYKRLFGEKVFDVYPSKLSGPMLFQIRHEICGHQVDFGMEKAELVIKTRRLGIEYELVPHTKLAGDFPAHFIEQYFHWLEVETHNLEFRPLDNPWETTPKNWRLSYSEGGSYMALCHEKMLDIRKQTAEMISSILIRLEYPQNIDVRFAEDSRTISAHLPRLKLDFFINEKNELECRQFRGMIVDPDQDIGTLYGLQNRLVMRQNSVRSVIVPYGDVEYGLDMDVDHIRVKIETKDRKKIAYHLYTVDEKLGRLVGNDSLVSHLYKIYLHAVTAHCLADPLTSRTGTEEALDNLRSAATWSFQKLEEEEVRLLGLIAALTPNHSYQPPHLQVMQSVEWDLLSMVAQHDEFYETVTSIFSHASRFHIFQEDKNIVAHPKSKSSTYLLERAATRNAVFRRDEFGGSHLKTTKDVFYVSRDTISDSLKESRAWNVARAVDCWSPILPVCPRLIEVLEGWGGGLRGSDGSRLHLGYDRSVLDGKFAQIWGPLYNSLVQATQQRNKYQLIFMLSAMAYSQVEELMIGTFLAFATNLRPHVHDLPVHSSYKLGDRYEPTEYEMVQSMRDSAVCFELSSESSLEAVNGESMTTLRRRRLNTYHQSLDSQIAVLTPYLKSQWPCPKPNAPPEHIKQQCRLLSIVKVMNDVNVLFESCYRNKELRDKIQKIQNELDSVSPGVGRLPLAHPNQTYKFQPCKKPSTPSFTTISLGDLFLRDPPIAPMPSASRLSRASQPCEQLSTFEGERYLGSLLSEFERTNSHGFEIEYANGMRKSLEALKEQKTASLSILPSKSMLLRTYNGCKGHLHALSQLIERELGPSRDEEDLLSMAGLWPCTSSLTLLRQLATNNPPASLGARWRVVFIAYGEAITMVQRAERLLNYSDKNDDFAREVENLGNQGRGQPWYPDWLLISIENNFLVRPVQAQIASEMISPTSGENETLQLNMGEGKSSVIVPIISAALADGKKLVRVVVLKPLAPQMFRLLVQRLSGLTNRRIFYMPFSRSLEVDTKKAKQIKDLYNDCMRVGGILLVQPEHILSFKLMGLDQLFDGKKEVAKILLDCQHWLEANSRDILDESDEILHVRHELIYTVGRGQSVDFAPTRWTIVQEVFGLIRSHVKSILKSFPQGLEIVDISSFQGSFPVIRILESEAGDALFSRVVADIFAGHSFRLFPNTIRRLAIKFVTEKAISKDESTPLLDYCNENDISRSTLLLLRGLIAEKLLFFALKDKRWRVEYGLDIHHLVSLSDSGQELKVESGNPSTPRSMLAVPYRAKDCPSLRAEFSHPDVAIALTCLSYYYTGLSDPQLQLCFEILLKSDNPVVEYESWTEGTKHPETLRQLSGINLVDNDQRQNVVFPRFRHNKSVIDFYLSRVVFPKEAKEFPHKLSSSGWDIAEEKTHPTTGFSGTNDNQRLLPLTIKQHESQEQLNTNAKVLSYLLQPVNTYLCTKGDHGERLKVDKLLGKLARENPPIQVLLDVGAQVLEKRNDEVAKDWLDLVPESQAQAAVFFNDDDELTVRSRDGSLESFMVSAFAKKMDQCLVYLDEVHTRGTDLKLPQKSRAAVTLGPGLTKDRLVQACMRMRKLGHGQSVIFCAPPEIDQKILKTVHKSPTASVEVSDVIKWSMLETCKSIRSHVPIWAKQGISYQQRYKSWHGSQNVKEMESAMLEPEAQTLEERFGLRQPDAELFPLPLPLEPRYREMCLIQKNCQKFEITSLHGAQAQEEQERELVHEVERERQIERPPKAIALKHNVHQDVRDFIQSGKIKIRSDAFLPAFGTLLGTSMARYLQQSPWTQYPWSKYFYTTADFAATIDIGFRRGLMNDFIRPVQWLAVSATEVGRYVVIMSPQEVNELIPTILRSGSVSLHMYSPKVTKSMRSFEDMRFCAIPPAVGSPRRIPDALIDQLNIFAGQLYLRNFDAYERLCGFLGLYMKEVNLGELVFIHSDGFVGNARTRQELGMVDSPFSRSPVLFLRNLMDCRRKGQTYLATHMGQILDGRLLAESDFDHEEERCDNGGSGSTNILEALGSLNIGTRRA